MAEGAGSLYQQKTMIKSEDWWAVWLGGFVFLLGLGPMINLDLLGWVVKLPVWSDFAKSALPASSTYKDMSGLSSSILTYLFLLAITTVGIIGMDGNLKRVSDWIHGNLLDRISLYGGWKQCLYCSYPG